MGRLGTSALRKAYAADACKGSAMKTIPFGKNGARVTINKKVVPAFQALLAVFEAHGYHPRKADTGAYNCRKITGGSGYSLHSYGIAVDVNWQSGPYKKRPAGPKTCENLWKYKLTDMPCEMVAAGKAIETNNGVKVFRWGGDYNTSVDAMHWEVVADPRDLATGINWATVQAKPPKPLVAKDRPELRKGMSHDLVKIVQNLVGAHPVDGDFGPGTEKAIVTWSKKYDLPTTGVWTQRHWLPYEALLKRGEITVDGKKATSPAAPSSGAAAPAAAPVPSAPANAEGFDGAEVAWLKDFKAQMDAVEARPSSLGHLIREFRARRAEGKTSDY